MKRKWKGLMILALALLLGAMTFSGPASAQDNKEDKVTKHFNFMDKNKDGVLTEQEFKMMGKDYKQQFQDADANKDGKVTLEEYKAWSAKNKNAMPGMSM